MSQQEQTPNQIDTGGGAYIEGNVSTGGDLIGRDKVVHGDEVKGDKVQGSKAGGDVIIGTVGAGAQHVAIGKNNRIITQLGAPTWVDRQLIEHQFEQILALVNHTTLDPRTAGRAEAHLETLQAELTKTADNEMPSAATISRLGDWLLANLPTLTPALTELFGLPAVIKVLAKAGEVAVQWRQSKFGKSG